MSDENWDQKKYEEAVAKGMPRLPDDRSDLLNEVVRNATLAADNVVIGFQGTHADLTSAMVRRALEFLLGNGMITLTPKADWPTWLVMDPLYQMFFGLEREE